MIIGAVKFKNTKNFLTISEKRVESSWHVIDGKTNLLLLMSRGESSSKRDLNELFRETWNPWNGLVCCQKILNFARFSKNM